jgi:hypothetical protein
MEYVRENRKRNNPRDIRIKKRKAGQEHMPFKAEIIHDRINPAVYQLEPGDNFILASEKEVILVRRFRQMNEVDQDMYYEEIKAVGAHTYQERQRTNRYDMTRAQLREAQ